MQKVLINGAMPGDEGPTYYEIVYFPKVGNCLGTTRIKDKDAAEALFEKLKGDASHAKAYILKFWPDHKFEEDEVPYIDLRPRQKYYLK